MNKHLLDTLDAIVHHKMTHGGCAPSIRWLCDALGIASTSTMKQRLERLRDLRYITFPDGQARSIQVEGGEWRIIDDDK